MSKAMSKLCKVTHIDVWQYLIQQPHHRKYLGWNYRVPSPVIGV